MFKHTLYNDDTDLKTSFHWFLLSFLAGNVNAGGYLACGRFVSHVTGFATLFGIDAAHGSWDMAAGILSVPLYFLLGVMISAYLIDRPYHRGRTPHYALVMALVCGCLTLAALGGHYHLFGAFGDVRLSQDYFLLSLLCMASGLQNAAITTSSGHTVRTTHLTGVTTDLGIGLVRAFTGMHDRKFFLREIKANELRIGTIVSFAIGSATGAILFLKVKYLGFLLPAGIAFYAMLVALRSKPRKLDSVGSVHPIKRVSAQAQN
ncbi:MAG: YoaK family protein [Bdellovibrionota bacterium]